MAIHSIVDSQELAETCKVLRYSFSEAKPIFFNRFKDDFIPV